jgi:hypothetical protein
MQKFLNSAVGSFLKVFLAMFLADLLIRIKTAGAGAWHMPLEDWAALAATSLIPVIINYINPADPRYGFGKRQDPVPHADDRDQLEPETPDEING